MNNIILKSLLATLALACALPSLAAVMTAPIGVDTSWADHSYTGPEGGTGAVSNGGVNFVHEWQFQLTAPSSGAVSIIANPLFSRGIQTVGITNGLLGLYLDSGVTGFNVGDTLIGTQLNFSSTGVSFTQNYASLAAGNYFYRVLGTTQGASGGNYALNSVMEVRNSNDIPLPSTLAMLLLPIAGLALRKR
jgi:hypothetical protein